MDAPSRFKDSNILPGGVDDGLVLEIEQAVLKHDQERLRLALDRFDHESQLGGEKGKWLKWPGLDALRSNQVSAFSLLLDHSLTTSGWISSSLLESKDSVNFLKALLDHGWDVNELGPRQEPCWWRAMDYDQTILEFLLTRGADINYKNRLTQCTALDVAAAQGSIETFKTLLKYDAEIKRANPLHEAAGAEILEDDDAADGESESESEENKVISMMEYLLDDLQLDINQLSNYGARKPRWGNHDSTPLHAAMLSESPRRVLFLLDRGADPGRTDKYGDDAAEFARKYECVKSLEALQLWMSKQ